MASIKAVSGGGVIRWDGDDWLAGLVPQYTNSIGTSVTGARGLLGARGIDMFRKPGYIMPGPYGTDISGVAVIDAVVKNGIAYGADAYLSTSGAKVQKMSFSGGAYTLVNAGDWPHTVTDGHASFAGEDVLISGNGGTKYMYYSYNDNTDGNVGRFDLASTFDDDYMSTVPTGGAVLSKLYPHPMIEGADGRVYIANGSKLASLNANVFNTAALDLPIDWVITSYAKTKNYLVVFAYRQSGGAGGSFYRSEAAAYFWDYVSSSYTYVIPLQGNYVSGGFIYDEDVVGCFVSGRSPDLYNTKFSQMCLGGIGGFTSVCSFFDNPPEYGGVDVESKVVRWNSAGVIYQYGSPHVGIDPALTKITEVIGGSSNGGILKNFFLSQLVASAGTTTSGGLQLLNDGYYFQSNFGVPLVNVPFPDQFNKAQVTAVKVFWGEAASGGQNFTLSLKTNRAATTTTVISNLSTVTSPSLITKYELDSTDNPLPQFDSIGITGQWSSGASPTAVPPYPQAIEVYYSYVNI